MQGRVNESFSKEIVAIQTIGVHTDENGPAEVCHATQAELDPLLGINKHESQKDQEQKKSSATLSPGLQTGCKERERGPVDLRKKRTEGKVAKKRLATRLDNENKGNLYTGPACNSIPG